MKKKKSPSGYGLDPRIFPPDPRSLDVIDQIIYVIRCLEHGLSEKEIKALYLDDGSFATVIIDLAIQTGLIRRDIKSGKWKRTEKARRLISGRLGKSICTDNQGQGR